MTGIEGVGWPTAPRVARRATTGSGFSIPDEPGGTNAATAASASEPAALASMLTLQEMGGQDVADREAREHAKDMLAALAATGHAVRQR
jgi:Class II flagellar assembly regulator